MSIKFNCAVCVDKKPVREAQLELHGVDSLGECIRKYGDAEVLALVHAALTVKLQNNHARPMLADKTDGAWTYTVAEVNAAIQNVVPSGERRAVTPRDKEERKLQKQLTAMGLSPERVAKMVAEAMAEYDAAQASK